MNYSADDSEKIYMFGEITKASTIYVLQKYIKVGIESVWVDEFVDPSEDFVWCRKILIHKSQSGAKLRIIRRITIDYLEPQ